MSEQPQTTTAGQPRDADNGKPSRFCRACNYDLSASPAGPCPECSRPFDPFDRRTFFPSSRSRRVRAWRLRAMYALIAVGVLAVFGPRGVVTTSLRWNIGPQPAPGSGSAGTAPVGGANAPTTFTWTETRIHLIPPAWLGPAGLGLPRYPWWTIVDGTPPPTPPTNTPASFDLSIKAAAWDWRTRPAGSLGGSASWVTGETMFINDVPADVARSSDIMNALAETYFTGGGGISFVSPETKATPAPTAVTPEGSDPTDRSETRSGD